jgi:alpha-ketoglutarate-dependent taurine dioxygenase
MDDATFEKIYRAWLDYNVVVVRGQALSAGDLLAYSARFGGLTPHVAASTRHPDHPEITLLGANKLKPDGTLDEDIYTRGAEGFHTDGTFLPEPYKATQLYALAIPSRGGDTHFASMYAAYDALPQRLKERLDGRYGAYMYGGRKERLGLKRSTLLETNTHEQKKLVFHPIFRTHRETGRKVLFFNPLGIYRIEGLAVDESNALIEELTGYMVQPHAMYTHKWAKGDVVIWDNRCSFHKAAGDYPPEEDRIHWRVSIRDVPGTRSRAGRV